MLAGALRRPGRGNDARFGAIFFFIALAPVLKIVPFGGNSLFNDRYMYLPSIGLFLVFALPFRRAFQWNAAKRASVLCAWSLVLGVFSVQSFERTKAWRDSETLWLDVLSTYPGTALALNNLGRFHLDERHAEPLGQERPDGALPRTPHPDQRDHRTGLGIGSQQPIGCDVESTGERRKAQHRDVALT